ncbi:T-complex protein 11-like protein 2 [Megalops cyprinoides]|uniref:T-complex protein 11-like protein 2 n=1 Tax=Megalops cyprinoides TaxID=118141 RepID=UPI0018647F4A|nr:T-complex protein 11-like protein 2 [Megalops cyprinoides]
MSNASKGDGPGSDAPAGVPDLQSPDSPSGSPPRQLSLLDVMQMENCLSNMTLAHEIVVNRDFHFTQNSPPKDSLEGRVKGIVHRAFWDSLQAQLSLSPADYSHALCLLQEVKEILQSLLLPSHTRLQAQLEEVLDMALIRQQAEHDALDLQQLSSYIISTMATLCAPVRDPEIRKLQNLSDPVDLLREIMRVLSLMKMDMVNFTVQSLRPHLLQQAVQYERAKFQQILDRQPASLDNTTAWLQGAVLEAATAGSSTESPEQGVTPPTGGFPRSPGPISPSAALNRAYLRLLTWDPDSQLYPETVLMDRARLEALGQTLQLLVLEAAVLLVTSTQCGGAVISAAGFVGNLKHAITALLEGSHRRDFDLQEALLVLGEQVQKQVDEVLNAQGGGAPPQGRDSLRGQIADLAQELHPIRALIGARIQSYLLAVLGAPEGPRGVPVPPSLTLLAGELGELSSALRSIVSFNRAVFGPYYSPILRNLILPQGEVEAGVDSR